MRAEGKGGKILLGYRESRSHRIVDLGACPVLVPELVALIAPLRKLLARHGHSQAKGNVHFADYLRGFASYVNMVHPEEGESLLREVDELLGTDTEEEES